MIKAIKKVGKVAFSSVATKDLLTSLDGASAANDTVVVKGNQYVLSSIEDYENGEVPFESATTSSSATVLAITTVAKSHDNPLTPPTAFALVAGAKVIVEITDNNTGAATLAVDGGAAKAIKIDDAVLTANVLEKGEKYVVTYDGVAWQLTTKATIEAAKVAGALVGGAVAAAAASAAAALVSQNAAAADVVLANAAVVLTAADVIAAAASAAAAAAAVTAEIYRAPGTAIGDAVPVAIDFTTGGNRRVIELTTNAAGGAFTLADGNMIGALDCREITFILAVHAVNDAVITPANLADGNTITMNAAGQSATLIYSETMGTWVIKATSSVGVVVA